MTRQSREEVTNLTTKNAKHNHEAVMTLPERHLVYDEARKRCTIGTGRRKDRRETQTHLKQRRKESTHLDTIRNSSFSGSPNENEQNSVRVVPTEEEVREILQEVFKKHAVEECLDCN